ncbi:MAG: tail fiber domain-containing protein, partial [Opitutae bacterium]
WDDPGANNTTGITFRNLKSSYPAIMTCSQGSHYLYRVGTGDMWTFGYKSSISATNVGVGTISTNGSSTSYNTTSDYRLKENVTELTGAIDRVKQVPVHRFNFTATPENTVDGFLAHEVQAVVPE